MSARTNQVKSLSASEVAEFLRRTPALHLIDVREEWELHHGTLPNAKRLSQELLDGLKNNNSSNPIILYCHFGIRSLDAACYLIESGIANVYILKGGIDAWSAQVDPSIPQYDGSPC